MRYALIENNQVENIIEADSPHVLTGKVLIEAEPHTLIGDKLTSEGNLPGEVFAWNIHTQKRERFTSTEPPPPSGYTMIPPPVYALSFDEIKPGWIVDDTGRRRSEILAELEENDRNSIRPLRAKDAGTATDDDLAILIKLEERAEELRQELKTILGE